jgi:hypothetical protein
MSHRINPRNHLIAAVLTVVILMAYPATAEVVHVTFRPLPISLKALHDEREFLIQVTATAKSPAAFVVELVLGTASAQRIVRARHLGGGRYTVRAVPDPNQERRSGPTRRLDPIEYAVVVRRDAAAGGAEVERVGGLIEVTEPDRPLPRVEAPALEADQITVPLPGPVDDVIPAANGRLLLFHIKSLRQVAVFDVAAAKVTKLVSLVDVARPVLMANARKLFVVAREAERIDRWDLATLEKDGDAPMPEAGRVVAMAAGYASEGPAVIATSEGEPRVATYFLSMFDTSLMRRLPQPAMRLDGGLPNGLTVGPDGRGVLAFALGSSASASPLFEIDRAGEGRLVPGAQFSVGAVPGPFTTRVFSTYGILPADRPSPDVAERSGLHCIPAYAPDFFVVIRYGKHAVGMDRVTALQIDRLTPGWTPQLVDAPELSELTLNDAVRIDGPRLGQRVHFYPQADLLVTLDATLKAVILRRVGIGGQLAKEGTGYLVVDSFPPSLARRGQRLVYEPTARASGAKPAVRLDYGPTGMAVRKDGRLEWAVPPDFADKEAKVVLHFSSGRQEAYQTFSVWVR